MKISYKIIALFFSVSFLFSVVANAGNDRIVFTGHNGNTDANLTEFTLDGSSSEGDIILWQWDQISGPYIEEFTDSNGNGIWDSAEELTDNNNNGICLVYRGHQKPFGIYFTIVPGGCFLH